MMLSLTFHSLFNICCHPSVEKVFYYLVHGIFYRIKTISLHPCFRVPQLVHPIKNKHRWKANLTGLLRGDFLWREGVAVLTQAFIKPCRRPLRDIESPVNLLEDFRNKKKWVPFLSKGCIVTFKSTIMNKNKQVSHSKKETASIILTHSSPNISLCSHIYRVTV